MPAVLAVAIEVAVWCLAVWLLTGRDGRPIGPWAWHRLARICWVLAAGLGQVAIVAERNYWKAVQA